jgi:hypothetical protein
VIEARNRIRIGDTLEFIGTGMRKDVFTVEQLDLLTVSGKTEQVESINPNQRLLMKLPFATEPFDLIRREKAGL